ncbi:hypothetical protein D9611_012214 [Ephemerocybe angulata]|uniref:Uncharacterized protein n=1 Tax=Ephemerocybe angulata TaxID=980116 RepID=A0A8H5C5B2_9AGAR|nr:hypothetical protein D9611_012214 [Tulosesus angulatus]
MRLESSVSLTGGSFKLEVATVLGFVRDGEFWEQSMVDRWAFGMSKIESRMSVRSGVFLVVMMVESMLAGRPRFVRSISSLSRSSSGWVAVECAIEGGIESETTTKRRKIG